MIHSFYSEFGVLEEEIEEKSDLWATHGFVSLTHSQSSQTLKGAGSFHIRCKTKKDLGAMAVLGFREQPKVTHNFVTHKN